jgi:hypothetical protein
MNELSDRFLDREETLYAEKVDSAGANTGFKRIEIKVYVASQRIDFVRVYFTRSSKADSVDIQVGNVSGVFSRIIEDMPASEYLFILVNFDKYGNRSLPYELTGRVLGDDYVNGLNRTMSMVRIVGGILEITWDGAPENSLYSELVYTNSGGGKDTLLIPLDENSRTIDNYASDLEYRTFYQPAPTAIDTFNAFNTEWTQVSNIPVYRELTLFDKSSWSVISWSSQAWEARANALIDGSDDTFWHSDWETPIEVPHWAIIDMGVTKEIAKINTYRRKGMPDTKSVWYYIGDDPDPDAASWRKIAEGTYESGDLLTMTFVVVAGRYLKIYLPDSNRGPYTSVAEVDVFGIE